MSGRVSEAIILAAGVAKRLSPFLDFPHKSLLEIGGKSLLARHLEHLESGGVERVIIVVGHNQEAIRRHVSGLEPDLTVEFVENPDYRRGSVLSLRHGLASVGETARRIAWMDADVLYHPDVLHRLLRSESPLCFLLDPRAEESGEEMMLGVTGDRVLHIDRGVGPGGWDVTGESVGFFAVGPEVLPVLKAKLDEFAATGREDAEYEEAVHEILPEVHAGYVAVDDVPWTEIDFPEDVEKAKRILEELLGSDPESE